MNWSIVIFCYNEEGSLQKTAEECIALMRKIATAFEIIIVNDGSTDNTQKVCEELEKNFEEIKIVKHERNLGIGMALKNGYSHGRYEYVCGIPGDGQFNMKELENVHPFNVLSFYSFRRKKIRYPFYRQMLHVLNRIFNRIFLDLKMQDVNWVKVYRKEQLAFVDIQLNSSVVESEICAKLVKAGCEPIELPSVYKIRTSGAPKGGSWKTVKKAVSDVWKLYSSVKKFNKKISAENAANKEAPLKNLQTGLPQRPFQKVL